MKEVEVKTSFKVSLMIDEAVDQRWKTMMRRNEDGHSWYIYVHTGALALRAGSFVGKKCGVLATHERVPE